eukprot:471754-Alexandrium_andersonii.AAC.1
MRLCHRLRPRFIHELCRAHVCTDRNCTVLTHCLLSALMATVSQCTPEQHALLARNAGMHASAGLYDEE